MPIECVCEADIKASPAACLDVAADASRWTEWARDLERVQVLVPFVGDQPMRVSIEIEILGVEKSAIVDVVADPEAHALTFGLVESPSLSEFAGGVRFRADGARTRMHAEISGTLIRTYAPRIERMASRKIETALTRDFVRFVERSRRR